MLAPISPMNDFMYFDTQVDTTECRAYVSAMHSKQHML